MEVRGASGTAACRASSARQDLDEVPSLKRRRISSVCSLVSPRDALDSSSKNGSRSRGESFASQSLLCPSPTTSSGALASVERTEVLLQTPSRDRTSLATAFCICSGDGRTSPSMAKAPAVNALGLCRAAVPFQSSPSTSSASSPLASSPPSHACSSLVTRTEPAASAAASHTRHRGRDSGPWPPAGSAASQARLTTPGEKTLTSPSDRKQLPAFSALSSSAHFPAFFLGRGGSSPRGGRSASPLSRRPDNGERKGLSALGGKNPCRDHGTKEARRERTCREKDEMTLHRDTSSLDDMEEEAQRSSSRLRRQQQTKGAHTMSTNAREERPAAAFNAKHETADGGGEDQGNEREEDSENDERDSRRGCVCDRASADGERRPEAEAMAKKGRYRDRVEERERRRESREQRRSFLSPSHSASVSSASSETEREKWRTSRRREINRCSSSVALSSSSPSGLEEEVGSEEEDSEYFLLPLQQREEEVRDAKRRRSRQQLRSVSHTREEAESASSYYSSRSRRRRRRRGREQMEDKSLGDSEQGSREESEDTSADEESEESTCIEYDAEDWTSSSDWEVDAMDRSRLSRRFRRYISSASTHGSLDPDDLSVSSAAMRQAFARRLSCSDRDSALSFSYMDWRRKRPACMSCRTTRSPSLYLLSEGLVASCDFARSRKAPAALWRESGEAGEEEATRLRRWKAERAGRREGGREPKRRRDRDSHSDRLSSSSPHSADSASDNDAWASLSSRGRASQQRRREWRGSEKVGDRGRRHGGCGEEGHSSSSGSTEEESEAERGRGNGFRRSLNEEWSTEEGENSESGGAREGPERESEGCEEEEVVYCEVTSCEGTLSRFGRAARAQEIDGARADPEGKHTRAGSGDRKEDMPDFDRNASGLASSYGSSGSILRRASAKDAARAQERREADSEADDTDEATLSHDYEVARGEAERVPEASASADGRREGEATHKRLLERPSDKDRKDRRREAEADLRGERGGRPRSRRGGERGGEHGESERARESEGRQIDQHADLVPLDAYRRRGRAFTKWHKRTEPPPVAGREARRYRALSPRQERRRRHRLMAAANRLIALASGAFEGKDLPENLSQRQTVFEESPRGQLDQMAFLEASRWLEEVENLHHCEDMTVIFQAVVFHPHLSERVVAALAVWSVAWLLPSLLPFSAVPAAETPRGPFNFGAVLALLLPSFYSPASLSSSPCSLHPARRAAQELKRGREPKNVDAEQVERNGERGEAETPSQPQVTRTTWAGPPPAANCRLRSMRCMLQAFLFSRPSFAVVFLAYFADCLDDQHSSHKTGSSSSVASSPVSSPVSPFASPSALFRPAVAPLSSSLWTASSCVSSGSAGTPRRGPAEARRRGGGGAEAGRKRVAAFLASVAGEGVASGKSGMTVGVCPQDFLLFFSKNEEREKKENALALKRIEGQDSPFILSSLSALSSPASVPSVSSLPPQGSWRGREAVEKTGAGANVGKPTLTNNEATQASEHLTDTNAVEEKCSCVTSATNTESPGRVERTIASSVLSDVHINSPSVHLSMARSRFLESVEAEAEARTARLLLRLQLSRVFQETLWNAPLLRAFLLNLALGFLLRGWRCSSNCLSSGHSTSPSVSSFPHLPCWLCLQGQCGGPVALCASRRRLLGPFFLLLDSPARVWNFYISGLARSASEPSLESARSLLVSKNGDETIGRENEASAANAEKARTAAEAPCGGGVPDGMPPSWKESGSGMRSSFSGVCSPSLRSVLVCVSLACEQPASSFRHRDARCASPSTVAPAPCLESPDSSLFEYLGAFADPENVARVLDAVFLHLGVSLLWLLSVQGCLVSLSKLHHPSPSSSPPGTSSPSRPPASVSVSPPLSPSLCLLSSSRPVVRELRSLALAVMEWMRHVASARQHAVLTSLHSRASSLLASPCGPSRLSISPLASSGFSLLSLAAPLAASAGDALLQAPAPRLCAFCATFPPSCVGPCSEKLAAPLVGEVPKGKRETSPSDREAKEQPHKSGETQGEGLGEEPSDAHGRLDEMRQAAEKRAGRDSLKILWDLFVGQETRRPAQGETFDNEQQDKISTAKRSAACASSSPPAGDAVAIDSGASRFSSVSSGEKEEDLLHLIFGALTGGPSSVCLSSSSPFPQPSPLSDSCVSPPSFSSPALFATSVANGFVGLDSLVSRLAPATRVESGGGQRGEDVASETVSPLEIPVQPPCLSNTSPRWLASARSSLSLPSASASPGYALLSIFLRSAAVGIYTRLGKLERLLRFSADFTKSAHHILLHAACLRKRSNGEAGKNPGDSRGDSERETATRCPERRGRDRAKESDEGIGSGAPSSRPQLLRVRGCTCLAYGVEAIGDVCFSRFPSNACSSVSAASSRCLPSLSLAPSPMATGCGPFASGCLPSFSSADIASLVSLSLPLPLALHTCAAAALAAPSSVSLAFMCISLPCSPNASPSTAAPRPSSALSTAACSPSDCSRSSAYAASPRPPFLLRGREGDAECETMLDACLLTPFLQGSEETPGRAGAGWTEPKQGEIAETASQRRERDVDDARPALRILPSVPFLRLCISHMLLRLLPDAHPQPATLSTPLVSMSPRSPFSSCCSSSLHPSSLFMGDGDWQSSPSQSQETYPGQIPSVLPAPVSLLPRCDHLIYANLYDALAAEDSPCGPQRRPKTSVPADFSTSASSVSHVHCDVSSVPAAHPLAQAARVVFPSASAKGTLLSLHPASTSRSPASLAVSSLPLSSSPAAALWLPSTCCYALFSRLLWREISSEDNLLLEVGSWLYPDEKNEDWDIFLSPALVAPPPSAGLSKASPPVSSRRADSETLRRSLGPCGQHASGGAREPLQGSQVAVLSAKEIYLYRSELLQALAVTLALPLLLPPRKGRERRDGPRLRVPGRRPGEGRGRSKKAGRDWKRNGRTESRGKPRREARGTEATDSGSGVSSAEGQKFGGYRVSMRFYAPQNGTRDPGREPRQRESPQDEDGPRERQGLPTRLRDPDDVELGPQMSSLATEQGESRVEGHHTRKGLTCPHGKRRDQQSRTRLRALTAFSVETHQGPPPPLTSPAFLLRLCRFTAFRVLSAFLEKRDREAYVETLERAMHEVVCGESRLTEGEKAHGAPDEAGSEQSEPRTADAQKESEDEREEPGDKGDESDQSNARAGREKDKKRRHDLHFGVADTARKKSCATEGKADRTGERRPYGENARVGFDDECVHLSRAEECYRRRGSRLCERIEEASESSADEDLDSEAGEGRAESKARMRFTASCGRREQRRQATCRSVVPFPSLNGDGRRRDKTDPTGSRRFASSGCSVHLDERLLRANFFSLPLPSRAFFSLESDPRDDESERLPPTRNDPCGVFSPFCLGRDRLAIEMLLESPIPVSSSPSRPPPASPSLASSSPTLDHHRSGSPCSQSSSSLRSPVPSLFSSGSPSLTSSAASAASSPCRGTASSASASFLERLEEGGKRVEKGPVSQPPSGRAPAPSSDVPLWPVERLQAHGLQSCLSLLDALRTVGASLSSSPPAASAFAALPGGPKAWRSFFACTVDRLLEDLLFVLLPGNANRVAPAGGPEALGCPFPRAREWGDEEEGGAFSSQETCTGRSERQARASRAATRRDAESTKSLREAEEQDRQRRKPLVSCLDRRSGGRSQRYRGDYSDSCDEQEDWAQEATERRHESAFHDFRSHSPRRHADRLMAQDVEFSDTSSEPRSPPPLSSPDHEASSRPRNALSSSSPRSALFSAAVLRLNRVTHPLFSSLVLHLLVRLLSSSSARRLPVFFSRLAARLALWPAPPLLRSLLEERRKEARKSRQHRECSQPVAEHAANAVREGTDDDGGREVLLLPARMAIALCRRCLSACEEEGLVLLPCVTPQMPVGAEKTNNTKMEGTTTGEDPMKFTLPQSDEDGWQTQMPNGILSSSASLSVASSSGAVRSARRFVGQGVCIVSWEEKEEHAAEKSLALLIDLLSGLRLALWAALECWKETVFHFFPMPFLPAPAASPLSESPAPPSQLSAFPSFHPGPLPRAGSSVLPGHRAAHSAAFSAFPFSDLSFSRWFAPSLSASHLSLSACTSALWGLRHGSEGGAPWVPSPQGKHGLHEQAETWRRGDTLEGSARHTGPTERCHSLLSVALELQEVFATLQLTLQNLSSAAVCFCLSRHTQARPEAEPKKNLNFTRLSAGKGQSEPEMVRYGWKERSRGEDCGRKNDREMSDAMDNRPPVSSDGNAIPVSRSCCEEENRLMANAKQEGGYTKMEYGISVDKFRSSSLLPEQCGRAPEQVGKCGSEETNPQVVNVGTVAQDIRKQKKRLALLRTAEEFVRNSVQTTAFLDHISRTELLPLVTQFASVSIPRAECVGGTTTEDGVSSEGRELQEETTKKYQQANRNSDAEDEREVSDTLQNSPPVGLNVEGTHTSLGQGTHGASSGERGKHRGVDGTDARRMREMNKCQLPAREHSTEPDEGSTCRERGTESGDLEEDPEPGCCPQMSPCSSPLNSSQGSPSEPQLPKAETITAALEMEKHGEEFCRQGVSARLNKQASDIRARPTAWSAGDLLHSLTSRWTLEAKELARLRSLLAVGSQNDLSEEDNMGSDSGGSETSGRRARTFRSSVPVSAPFTTSTAAACEPQWQQENKDDGQTGRFLDFRQGREREERLTTRAVAASKGRNHDSSPAGFPEDERSHLFETKEGREGQSPFRPSSVSSFDLYGRREGRRRRDEAERDETEERESTEEEFAHLMSELVDPTFTDPMSVVDEPPPWLSRLSETDSGIIGEATADYSSPAVFRTGFNRSEHSEETKREKPSLSGDSETARGHQLFSAPGEVPGGRDTRQRTLNLLRPRKIRPVWFSFINSLFNPGSVPSAFRRGEAK
ncbi:hypothetical protein TGGT1_253870 [Toxoplasma gondii GT1]|uniref:Uncharacterized protein n=2 Tax=Toxoplasma gondii TaxID=5811 RepID=S7W1U4_TOXGG|nr:hypothetical protein TGGT1_253870 [Toxoplasma gondii GT1]KFG52954.1 hypothetical protein TGFOU_253870 [Toxoplasma gondii FOU]